MVHPIIKFSECFEVHHISHTPAVLFLKKKKKNIINYTHGGDHQSGRVVINGGIHILKASAY